MRRAGMRSIQQKLGMPHLLQKYFAGTSRHDALASLVENTSTIITITTITTITIHQIGEEGWEGEGFANQFQRKLVHII